MESGLPVALQLCTFSPDLEAGLSRRLDVIPWHAWDAGEQATWLSGNADRVRAVITGGHIGCPLDLMAALPSLGLIAINGVGYDKVDVNAAHARGIHVTTTPDVLTDDVADLAVGLVISLLRGLPQADLFVRSGRWENEPAPLARKVSGRRFGIVGLGRIGTAIARRLEAFGPVSYTGSSEKPVPYAFYPDARQLAQASDVLVLACAANASTEGIVDKDVLAALGHEGWLVNVARGSVVDETALGEALDAGGIAGAALDVFAHEPHVPSTLRDCAKTVLTPHIASATVETRKAMADLVLANVDAFLAGTAPPSALAEA